MQHFALYESAAHPGLPSLICPGELAEVGTYVDSRHTPAGIELLSVTVHRCEFCRRMLSVAIGPGAARPVILNDYLPPAPAASPVLDPRD